METTISVGMWVASASIETLLRLDHDQGVRSGLALDVDGDIDGDLLAAADQDQVDVLDGVP